MAKTQPEQQTDPAPVPVAPQTPSHGGSYLLDDATGEHTLIERTQQNAPVRSKP